jgi:hypothetical protein
MPDAEPASRSGDFMNNAQPTAIHISELGSPKMRAGTGVVISLEERLLQKIEEAIADAERRRSGAAHSGAQGDSNTLEDFLVRMREQRRRVRRDFYLRQQSSTDSLLAARQLAEDALG